MSEKKKPRTKTSTPLEEATDFHGRGGRIRGGEHVEEGQVKPRQNMGKWEEGPSCLEEAS